MYVYFILCNGRLKVGRAKNVSRRVSSLQIGNPVQLHLYAFVKGTQADEKRIHAEMHQHHIRGEWFNWNAATKRIVDFEVAEEIRNRRRGNRGDTYNFHDWNDVLRFRKNFKDKDVIAD